MNARAALISIIIVAAAAVAPQVRAECEAVDVEVDERPGCVGAASESAPRPPPPAWWPTSSGPFVAITAPIPSQGELTFQPLVFWTMVRGDYGPDSTYTPLAGHDALSSLAGQLFLEYGLPWRFSVGGQAAVVRNWAASGNQRASATGLGDWLVFGRFALLEEPRTAPAVTLLAQLKLPTARFERADPERLGTDLTGTGTWDATFGVSLSRPFRPVFSHFDLLVTLPSTARVDGVETRHGWRFLWSLAAEVLPFGDKAGLMLELSGRHEPDQRLSGLRAADTHTNELLLGVGVELNFSEKIQALAGYQRTLWGTNLDAIDVLGVTLVSTL